jgi:hypothetical protein
MPEEHHVQHACVTGFRGFQAAGIDTRSALLKFHEEYYSANIMSLVVVGKYVLLDAPYTGCSP